METIYDKATRCVYLLYENHKTGRNYLSWPHDNKNMNDITESEFDDICGILISRNLATKNKIFYLNYVDAVADFVNSGLKLTATTNEVKEAEKKQVNITTHHVDNSTGKIIIEGKNKIHSVSSNNFNSNLPAENKTLTTNTKIKHFIKRFSKELILLILVSIALAIISMITGIPFK